MKEETVEAEIVEEVMGPEIFKDVNEPIETEIKTNSNVAPLIQKTGIEKFSDGLHKHWFLSFVALIMLIIILHKLNVI